MKANTVFKECLFLLSLVVLSQSISAQSFRPLNAEERIAYPDNQAILLALESKADSIIASKNYLTPADAKKQLEMNLNRKVKIKQIKPNSKVLSSEEIAKRLKESTVIVADAYLCGKCSRTHINPSSGYVIDETGIFVTNYHVIESFVKPQPDGQSKLSLQVMTGDGEVYAVSEVLSANKDLDLAVVKLAIGNRKLVPLALGSDAAIGAEVFVLSHPHMLFDYFSKGIVARKFSRYTRYGAKDSYPEMEITADFAAGSSGAAVVDNKGNVISTVATTWSLYYDTQRKTDLQMVVKGTKPVICLKELLSF